MASPLFRAPSPPEGHFLAEDGDVCHRHNRFEMLACPRAKISIRTRKSSAESRRWMRRPVEPASFVPAPPVSPEGRTSPEVRSWSPFKAEESC